MNPPSAQLSSAQSIMFVSVWYHQVSGRAETIPARTHFRRAVLQGSLAVCVCVLNRQTPTCVVAGRAKYVALKDVDAAIGNMFQTPMIQAGSFTM